MDKLRLAPRIPDAWTAYKIHYRYRATTYHITVRRVGQQPQRVLRAALDGAGIDLTGQPHCMIPLVDDRRDHYVEMDLG